jgi:hypothetical protein
VAEELSQHLASGRVPHTHSTVTTTRGDDDGAYAAAIAIRIRKDYGRGMDGHYAAMMRMYGLQQF